MLVLVLCRPLDRLLLLPLTVEDDMCFLDNTGRAEVLLDNWFVMQRVLVVNLRCSTS
jgi:hypothetical protein